MNIYVDLKKNFIREENLKIGGRILLNIRKLCGIVSEGEEERWREKLKLEIK